MSLPKDISRCWDDKCERKDTCARFTERDKNTGPETPHHWKLCGGKAAYIPAKNGTAAGYQEPQHD